MGKVINKKTLNPALKKHLYEYVPRELERIPFFTKVYGSGYAKERLKKNLKNLYTNESSVKANAAGYQNAIKKEICICDSGENGGLLKVKDIHKYDTTEGVAIHECIHAIFSKDEDECKKNNCEISTGLFYMYNDPNTGKRNEIGRYLNEGYTEWLCGKLGYVSSYPELTKFVNLIECAIGTEKTMTLGKGEICKSMGLEIEKSHQILSTADMVGEANSKLDLYKKYLDALSKDNPGISSKKKMHREELYDVYIKKNNSSFYKDVVNSNQFKKWAEKNNKEYSEQSYKEFIEYKLIPISKLEKETAIINFESMILEKYFMKNLNKVFHEEEITSENYEKCEKIFSYINSSYVSDETKNMYRNSTVVKAMEEFEQFKRRYVLLLAKKEANKYNEGKLDLKQFIKDAKNKYKEHSYIEQLYRDCFLDNVKYKHRSAVSDILDSAWNLKENDKYFKQIPDLEVYSLSSRK